ncbi:MAG: sulfatase-like hydrolase/transferase [Bacteroidota bacterium]
MKKSAFFICVLISTFFFDSTNGQQKDDPPLNIICILADDLGYGDLSCMGATDMRTPNIDQLAGKGLTFTQFYANSTVCSPSRAALLSGKYPDLAGVPGVIRQDSTSSWGYLRPKLPLIPNILKEKGYHSAIIGKWHLGISSPNTPNERGFDYYKGFLGDMMDDYYTHLRKGENWMRLNDSTINSVGHATDLFTDWTIDYLEKHRLNTQPFFLYLAYNAPHFPIQPPDEFLKAVKSREDEISAKRAKNVALIEHLDFNVGRILNYLKTSGLEDNTLVIFTSDNGGALRYEQNNGELRGGKGDMYEGGLRVPTFFYWKDKIMPGTRTDNFVMLMDILPTLCEILEIKTPPSLDGISFLPTLMGKEQNTADRYSFWMRREGGKYHGLAYHAARYGPHKLVQNTPFEPFQYFDLSKDPWEQNPIRKIDSIGLNKKLQEHIRQSGKIPWQPVIK